MGKLNCFFVRLGKKKKNKVDVESSRAGEFAKRIARLHINIEQPVTPFETDELKLTSFSVPVPYDMQDNSFCNAKVMSHESPVGDEPAEIAYEGEDEHEENLSIKREFSDFDLQAHVTNSGEEEFNPSNRNSGCFDSIDAAVNGQFENQAEKGHEKGVDIIRSGHVSDPGIGKAEFWASPELKRSCSNLETSVVLRKIADQLPPSKSESYNELQELASKLRQNFDPGSPGSVKSHLSADRVMLKKRSSSQILPSRSRRLWWKLFLWSHRNLHKPWISRPQPIPTVAALKQSGGYSSDTLEPNKGMNSGKILSPGSYTDESLNKDWSGNYNNGNSNLDGFDNGISAVWPHNQWFAFQPEPASFKRVDEWVKDLETLTPIPVVDNEVSDEGIVFPPPSLDTGKSPARITAHSTYRTDINLSAEILHANSVIQSLNPSSTVAHIANIGLKAIPTISRFSGLRTVNLSNNFIVHITGGSLPKGLQILNLSRNKITTIEGLRELTRLRVLDLSYNRISRIGHGLSSCTIIKELYLAGNKISDIEGLHRLLKLTVLDMSFNKITTTKALGQLVANYNSLLALNLLGNPIQSNISDDQLRKAVCSLLPKLVYLNKQPIKPQRARELLNDSVAKAVLGSSSKSTRRKAGKRSSRSETFPSAQRSGVTVGQKNKGKLKSQSNSHSPLKTLSSAHASSSSKHVFG